MLVSVSVSVSLRVGIDRCEDVVPEAYDSARDHVVCGDPLRVDVRCWGFGDELAGL